MQQQWRQWSSSSSGTSPAGSSASAHELEQRMQHSRLAAPTTKKPNPCRPGGRADGGRWRAPQQRQHSLAANRRQGGLHRFAWAANRGRGSCARAGAHWRRPRCDSRQRSGHERSCWGNVSVSCAEDKLYGFGLILLRGFVGQLSPQRMVVGELLKHLHYGKWALAKVWALVRLTGQWPFSSWSDKKC